MSDLIFKHLSDLSDTTRVRLLRALEHSPCSVGELTEALAIPQPTISRHLKILLQRSWVSRQSQGSSVCYRFQPSLLQEPQLELWSVVSAQSSQLYPSDLQRLRSVLLLRRTDSQSFFQRIGARWAELRQDMFGDTFLMPTLLTALGGDQVIVDVGCGAGEVLSLLSPVSQKVIGVDASTEMLQLAAERTSAFDNVELINGKAHELGVDDDSADVVLAMLVLHHTEDPMACLEEFCRVLRPGGRLVILDMCAHTHHSYLETMGHRHLGFTPSDLQHQSLALQRWTLVDHPESAMGPQLFLSLFGFRSVP